jgi:glycosyltransferase 2 family protein
MIVTLVLHVMTMLITFGTLQAVSVSLSLAINLAVYAIAGLMIALPITIQGIGVREGVYLGLLGLVGVAPERVLAAMALNYVILICLSICGGVLFWIGPRQATRQVG